MSAISDATDAGKKAMRQCAEWEQELKEWNEKSGK
jgi:hypothetical protein